MNSVGYQGTVDTVTQDGSVNTVTQEGGVNTMTQDRGVNTVTKNGSVDTMTKDGGMDTMSQGGDSQSMTQERSRPGSGHQGRDNEGLQRNVWVLGRPCQLNLPSCCCFDCYNQLMKTQSSRGALYLVEISNINL